MRPSLIGATAALLLAVPAAAQAPPPLSLTGATVRQSGEDVVARLDFSAPVPADTIARRLRADRAIRG